MLKELQPYTQFKNDVLLLGKESSSGALAEIKYATNLITITIITIINMKNLLLFLILVLSARPMQLPVQCSCL